jgi:hypothetical protein
VTVEESTLDVAATSSSDAPKRKLLVPLLVAGLVVAVALAAVFGALWLQSKETSSDEVQAFLGGEATVVQTRAEKIVNLLMNYDSSNLDDVSQQVLAIATGSFADDYRDTLKRGLGDALKENTASSRGQILEGPDVFFKSPSEATAIVRAQQTTQSNDDPTGQTFTYVMQLTLVNTSDGGWKADGVQILSQQTA